MKNFKCLIKDADINCDKRLTEIAFSAKRYWNYPEEYYDIWKNELTITEEYIKNNIVKTIGNSNIIKGFYSFCFNDLEKYIGEIFIEKGYWLDHMFIEKRYIGKGLGKMMFNDLINDIKNRGGECFNIFVDPFARGFYEKMGCIYIRESKSSIENRTIPVYKYKI